MLEKISFRPTESERAYLEELYLRSGAKTVTEFLHTFLQDSMTQKGGGSNTVHLPSPHTSHPSAHSQSEMVPARQDGMLQFRDSTNMMTPTALLLQAQREYYEHQMQGMNIENHNLRSEVAYLRQQLQYSAMPYGPNGMCLFQQQQLLPQQNYVPWNLNQPSYPFYPYYPPQPQYPQTEPPAKDVMDIWIEATEKMNRWKSAMNGYRGLA